ncbi:MAG: SDR family oxidoreductase [Clostridia bacterium]|nr:SDR family oxidoreductase [Clostridia bacterium]
MNVMELLSLKGKVALVTGGSGKYGSQITEALAEAGATVITASRSLEKNEAFAAALREKGYDAYGETYDQADESTIVALKDRILEKFGRLDVLVNNSVLRGQFTGGFFGDSDGFARSLDINGRGFFVMTRTMGTIMEKQGSGSIINIGSYMGMLGPNQNLYAGTGGTMGGWGGADYYYHKGGMHQFTRFLAAYYGEFNVRCNCLSLGGLFNNQHPAFVEEYSKACYIHRLANQDDIKGIIVYLASDASQYTTGTVIPVDGGYSAR